MRGDAFALHGLWRRDQRLALWAEAPGAPAGPPAGPVLPAPHPFAASGGLIARLLSGAGPGLEWLAGRAESGSSRLLLPTLDGRPLPSPELAPGGPPGRAALRPWRVPCLVFGPADAAQLLGALHPPRGGATLVTELSRTEPVEVPYGASLRWLTEAHDLAWRMAGRGQVLPVLRSGPGSDGTAEARWQPAPDGPGLREIAALAARVPPVARAEWDPAAHPQGRAGAELTDALLDRLTDAEVRAALEDSPPLLPGGEPRPGDAAELWLRALTSADARILGAGRGELNALRARLAAWHATAGPADAEPLRLAFRLAEPLGGHASEDDWRLLFLAHPAEEPTLLLAAAELWQDPPGAALAALEARLDRPREAFLAQLERAAATWPGLTPALRDARPAGLPLTREGALAFLREGAPALLAAGFGVELPSWWQRPPRLGLTLTARALQPGAVEVGPRVGEEAVQAFRWRAALGDRPLTEDDLRELAAAKAPLVRLHGQWTAVDQRQIAAALDLLARQGEGTASAVDVLRAVYLPGPERAGLPVIRVRAGGALRRVLNARGTAAEPPPLPTWFAAELRPYQERGLAWLAALSRLDLGAVLADDMGLGKTVQLLALLAAESEAVRGDAVADGAPPGAAGRSPTAPDAAGARVESRATLLVSPLSLLGNWQREAARFAPGLTVHAHHGTGRADAEALGHAARHADLVLTTYGTAVRDAHALAAIRWRRLVADEAQHVKNLASARSRALRALPARHRVALTGTPVENRLADLHAMLDFANPGLFGSAGSFRDRFSVPIELNGRQEPAEALRRLTGPFLLRRRKSDPGVLPGLPEKHESTVLCRLTAEQASLYQAVVARLLSKADRTRGMERKGLILSSLTRLKQICNHPAHYLRDGSRLAGRSGKLDRLETILETAVGAGEKALCFTQFAEFGTMLRGHLDARLGGEVLFLHGGVPRRERERMVDRFQDPDGPSVFLLSLGAGGFGLNLTEASHVVHIDRWWNPAVESQATDRAFRIGQRRDVHVHKFVCAGTIEERVEALAGAKRDLAEAVVRSDADGSSALTDLSTEALRELITLSTEAADVPA
ncbi:DEAD/DEAH box helicase [Streptomyces sp. DSM 44917]|uniref:DEAD/DEAH box helicase n=1 Tax=Streptomyces boetiae TaxID=3075541 RepID=A0ABU2LDY0_9ACTN|nr:DEAD/DEAH box helicase [Streptomyces sp. DSM 44917]MDT0309487.1 DEAD/DEAH box helicase [Streptomyces sp. DSM 44917]